MAILVLATSLLLGVDWGEFSGVLLLVVALVFGATGWGILLAAISRTPGQASAFGTALALIFAAAAGNFVPRQVLPEWLQMASYISPNAWGLEGIDLLRSGASLGALAPVLLALFLMGTGLFAVSMLGFRRQLRS
jgi:ABC-2 type transport system permease protein